MPRTIALIFGGQSVEHDISVLSYLQVLEGFKALPQFEVLPIYIDQRGVWHGGEKLKTLAGVKAIANNGGAELALPKPQAKEKPEQGLSFWKKKKIDVVFPIMHGTNGEDGTMQGLLNLLNVPFVGADLEASVVAMNKDLTKLKARALGVPVLKDVVISLPEWREGKDRSARRVESELGLPVITKPSHLGSSIGINVARDFEGILAGLELGFELDNEVLVEPYLEKRREIQASVIGNLDPIVSELEEPNTSDRIFTFQEKYEKGGKKKFGGKEGSYSQIPADLSPEQTTQIKDMARKIWLGFGLSGISRIDFMMDKQENIYLNEINPMPGTIQMHLWEKSGLDLPDLLVKLISYAEERFEAKQKLVHEFQSNVLK